VSTLGKPVDLAYVRVLGTSSFFMPRVSSLTAWDVCGGFLSFNLMTSMGQVSKNGISGNWESAKTQLPKRRLHRT
jgi:hypothetical protein